MPEPHSPVEGVTRDDEDIANLQVYTNPEVAAHYASLDYLTPCERLLFDAHLKPGMAILDVGVGGGRITPYLSSIASHYVGVDYSEEMVRNCRNKFPQLDLFVADASDLSRFPDLSFDAIVMAFNTLDHVIPGEKRRRCLRECWRLLRPGGVFIFSSHNPRACFARPGWSRERLREFARRFVAERSRLFPLVFFLLTVAKAVHSFLRAAIRSVLGVIRRTTQSVFWHGEGYLLDSAHGGMMTHYWIPARVISELAEFNFQFVTLLGDDYPRKSRIWLTGWYYYVFSKKS
jgi:ubiquinone/menaquinone biosynthesis C-methylase UbiE